MTKIALEEHYLHEPLRAYVPELPKRAEVAARNIGRMIDVGAERLDHMDRAGIDVAVLSHSFNGIQGVTSASKAVELARATNDALADLVSGHDRFEGFAVLPLQDPEAAAAELRRATQELGLVGALVNGYTDTQTGEPLYYDTPEYLPFWAEMEALGVPLYLHPRFSPPGQLVAYEKYPFLRAGAFGFGVECALHSVRLMLSGVFDAHPGLKIILGHLGETLPFILQRMAVRMRDVESPNQQPVTHYLNQNFYITTSGIFHTPSFIGALLEMGADRILFATDYPYESMEESATWLDGLPIGPEQRRKIESENARTLLGLDKGA
jgi:gamma-resorcylate decarboxylase